MSDWAKVMGIVVAAMLIFLWSCDLGKQTSQVEPGRQFSGE